jgi:predicted negative regulator of RcsB-dependent stress response
VIRLAIAALIAIGLISELRGAGIARADEATGDADRAFHDASQRASAGDPGALDALERLGAARPVTRWTDDAWAEAARLAERTGDYPRARHALQQVIALGTDEALVRRARMALERLGTITGAGQWDAVAHAHEQLVDGVVGGGDPTQALEALEALVRAHPSYPRGAAARLVIARGWEEEGQVARALDWLRDAVQVAQPGGDADGARIALTRALIRHGALDEARGQLALIADRGAAHALEAELAGAQHRVYLRWSVFALLLALLGGAALVLRRDAGSWRAAWGHLRRPPIEALYFLPIGTVVAVIAQTGNPLVAHAVVQIVLAGALTSWISGAMIEASRRDGRATPRRLGLQILGSAAGVLATVYLVVDRTRLLDLVVETWKHGPAPR